jgi:hypothetical protein
MNRVRTESSMSFIARRIGETTAKGKCMIVRLDPTGILEREKGQEI